MHASEPFETRLNFHRSPFVLLQAFHMAAQTLGWVTELSDPGISIFIRTGIPGAANQETVSVTCEPDHFTTHCLLRSESTGTDNDDPWENKKNIQLLISEATLLLEKQTDDARWEKEFHEMMINRFNRVLIDGEWQEAKFSIRRHWKRLITGKVGNVTFSLMAVNVLIFLMMWISGAGFFSMDADSLIRWGGNYTHSTLEGDYWRLQSNVFLHGGIMHLLMNMYGLFIGGTVAEAMMGPRRFLIAYLICGLTASAVSLYFHDEVLSVGASGAIFGAFGISLGLSFTSILAKDERKSLWSAFGIFVAINLIAGAKEGIDNWAHLGGLVSGLAGGMLYSVSLRRPEKIMRRKLMDILVPVSGVALSMMLVFSKPVEMPIARQQLTDYIVYSEKGMRFWPKESDTSAEKLQMILDSGVNSFIKAGRALEHMRTLKTFAASREELISRMDMINRMRMDAFRMMHYNLQNNSYRYSDSVKILVNSIDSLEKAVNSN